MTEPVFGIGYAKTHDETMRWASIAIAVFMAVVAIIFAGVIASRASFRNRLGAGDTERALMALKLAFMFLFTLAATFLSWYVAALHLGKDYLIALDVLNFVVLVLLGFAAYFYYRKTDPSMEWTRGLLVCSMIIELVALIVLLAGPQAAGAAGTVTQSALYVPLFITTLAMLGSISLSPVENLIRGEA